MADPDFIYDPENWEVTYDWADRDMLEKELDYAGECRRFCTLIKGPDKWSANVAIAFDEDGCPEEWVVRWFDSEAEAKAACESRATAEGPVD